MKMKNMSINLRTCFMDKKSYEAARSVNILKINITSLRKKIFGNREENYHSIVMENSWNKIYR